ncbi:MAG: DsrH/TusB family sulfur metabolism protein [Methyloprofundus sp.]|nr:DsrH/TusB family sulfur metabolism protein [Methyloprofundus sp.]
MLHIINRYPLQHSFLEKAHTGDTIMIKDDAVYALTKENLRESLIEKSFAHFNLCVKKSDLLLRNIAKHELIQGVSVIEEFDEPIEHHAYHTAFLSCN